MQQQILNPWLDEYAVSGAREPIPVTYHVQLAPELVRLVEVYSAIQSIRPETAIAEAVRAYLGAAQ